MRRTHLKEIESRNLAWEAFRGKFEHKSEDSLFVPLGYFSIVLAFVSPFLLLLTVVLLLAGYYHQHVDKQRLDKWLRRKSEWERHNPPPTPPILKHFHDPTAELSPRDFQILKIFEHWPGYPPFWSYLRQFVIARDRSHCQVSGCPSRLELQVHHKTAVSDGGAHSPDNLITLCKFHHALEPDTGHERIWGDIKTSYFTLVRDHERGNRVTRGIHQVRAHLRRLQLITVDELHQLAIMYGLSCPSCQESQLKFSVNDKANLIKVKCPRCGNAVEGPQQISEETGPMLAEILLVTRHRGSWTARWDMLLERRRATWGTWSGSAIAVKRKGHRADVAARKVAPVCPVCESPMKLMKPKPQDHWKPFWGCTQYKITGCKGSARAERH